MSFRGIIASFGEVYTKHINTPCGWNEDLKCRRWWLPLRFERFTWGPNIQSGESFHIIIRNFQHCQEAGYLICRPPSVVWKGHEGPEEEGGAEVRLYSFFNLGARWMWVINATARPLYPRERPDTQGRIKLSGAPRQWKHFSALFQAVFLSGGGYYLPDSQTPRLPVPRQK